MGDADKDTFLAVNIAVLTVSDTRTLDDDRSGDTLVERLEGAGHKLQARDIVKDEIGLIAGKLRQFIDDPEIDVVITTTSGDHIVARVHARELATGDEVSLTIDLRGAHLFAPEGDAGRNLALG